MSIFARIITILVLCVACFTGGVLLAGDYQRCAATGPNPTGCPASCSSNNWVEQCPVLTGGCTVTSRTTGTCVSASSGGCIKTSTCAGTCANGWACSCSASIATSGC